MPGPPSNQIIEKIEQASSLYHRLVLLVAPSGTGKTSALREVGQYLGSPVVNVNLELSRRMLDLTVKQRAQSLKQDPLRLLQGLSRNRTVVATWNGEIKNQTLIYAGPEHPEYHRYPASELVVAELKKNP
ncbi:MAG: BREX-3 system P-loop-containing protein BrxF [Deltaproteobacteria bacterium]|nr:BREX-3 system P-loop-containing protein BrxF [Deltaproteobacteria bacterium]